MHRVRPRPPLPPGASAPAVLPLPTPPPAPATCGCEATVRPRRVAGVECVGCCRGRGIMGRTQSCDRCRRCVPAGSSGGRAGRGECSAHPIAPRFAEERARRRSSPARGRSARGNAEAGGRRASSPLATRCRGHLLFVGAGRPRLAVDQEGLSFFSGITI